MSIARYYAWLTRFQDAARRVGHDTGRDTLTVHRRLRSASGEVSGDVLHEILDAALAATAGGRSAALEVLDAGCGLGGTLLYLQARIGARGVGITLSPAQAAQATAAAAERRVADACRFAVRDYDAPLDDLVPDGVDLVVAIESLAHAPHPAATLAGLAQVVRPGGRMVVVDDVPDATLAARDVDLTGFQRGWHAPAVLSSGALEAAFTAAGLTVVHAADLTPHLVARHPTSLAVRLAVARAAWPLAALTPARELHDAIAGGLHLERLYARGAARYRLLVGRRAA